MRANSLLSLASIAVILVLGSLYLTFDVVRVHPFAHELTVSMTIPRSGGVLPRSKVLLSGVQVGQVSSVTHRPDGVLVRLRLSDRYPIPAASAVRIDGLSGLGESYIEFEPPLGTSPGPYLRDGQAVQATKIAAPISIPDVAATTTKLMHQLDPAALSAIVDTFSQAMSGTEAVVPELSRATDLLAATLISRTDLIRQMLLALQGPAADMDWAEPALVNASGPWADFGPRVSEVAASIAAVIRAGNMPDSFLEDTKDKLGLVPFLRELTDRIRQIGPEIAPLAPLLVPVYATATPILQRLDLGSLIDQALHATSPDGTLRLQITVK
ncbi:MlaD family protein [Nocardia sp. CDC160]|uniref:MlaD family protein n=1 Tax=Nocardia sp. CDC160 TaxID=3112166 RepID=UPI002DBB2ADC|nr:MlaD family protein [Nocardia sp. CDC160]MEC3919351.1 MlaD family protein [Nocardia sp. CDC160]